MAVTENIYVGDGNTVLFSFTFQYLNTSDIKVSLDGVNTSAYSLANATTVQMNTAPTNGVEVRIYRQSDDENLEATFYPGSSIRATNLNENFLQALYLNQETRRIAQEASLGGIADGSIGTAKLASGAVTSDKLGESSVDTDAIADSAVTPNKLAPSSVTAQAISAGAVGTSKLASDSVTNDKIAPSAVGTTELASSAVTQDKIGTNILAPRLSSVNGAALGGYRNSVINGNFDVWQRGTSFASPVFGTYTADRWFTAYDGTGGTRSVAQGNFTPGQPGVPYEPKHFLRYTQSVASSGQTFNGVRTRIEGVRSYAGQQVSFSCWLRASGISSALTVPNIRLTQRFGNGGSPSSSVAVDLQTNISVADFWQYYTYTVTLPSISGKTLGTDGDDSLELLINFPINSAFQIDVSQVQLEAGSVSTPFERRPLGDEYALCQRYYETSEGGSGRTQFSGNVTSGQDYFASMRFMQTKRATPTVTLSNSTAQGFPNTGTVIGAGIGGFQESRTANTTQTGLFRSTWTAESEL